MTRTIASLLLGSMLMTASPVLAADLKSDIAKDYKTHLGALWDHFHRNPELSLMEVKTAKRIAEELRAVGFEVTEGIGGT
ncbi:MAG: amidohydrolase, partial [Sphingomonadales bacterium]|nr:amidohydrolase [Sphingomonadales bacterium]